MPADNDLLLIFEATPGATLVLSPAFVIEAVSTAYLAVTGVARDQLVGQDVFAVFVGTPGSLQAATMANLRASLQQVLATGQPHRMADQAYDLPDPARPGRLLERHWRPLNTPVLGPDGRVRYILHHVEDVTEQLRAEAREHAALATAEAERRQLRDVLTQLPAQVATYHGPEFVYDFVNARYQAYFPQQAFVGRAIGRVLPEAATNGVLAVFERVYQTGEAFHDPEREFWLTTHDQAQPQQLFLSFTLLPLRDGQGRTTGLLDFSYDVTERVLARRQLEAQQQQALRLNEELAAGNAEMRARNAELAASQWALRQLNAELEARVQARTQELADQQRLLHQVLRQLPASVATLSGPEHRLTLFNDYYQRLLSGRAVLGGSLAETLPEAEAQGFTALLDQVYATGQPFEGRELPLALYSPAGPPTQHYIDLTYQPLTDRHGQVQGILGFGADVTERVRARRHSEALQAEVLAAAQRQARQREELYQVFEQMPIAILLLREPDYQVEYFNPAYAGLFAGQPEVGRALLAGQPAAAELLAHLGRVYHRGETAHSRSVPFWAGPAAGGPAQLRYFDFTYQPYQEAGQTAGVSIFAVEVTELVRARQASEASAQRLRLLTDALPVLIGYVDRELRYQFANQAYQAWFNQDPAALLGRPVREVVGEKAFAAAHGYMARVLAGEQLEFTAHMPYREGFVRYIQTAYIPDWQGGQVAGFYTLVTDITEQTTAREQVQQLNEELQTRNGQLGDTNQRLTRTNSDLDTFVYTASHDLKAPIVNIEGLLQVLREELPAAVRQAPAVAPVLGLLDQSVTRFLQTLADLGTVAQLNQPEAQEEIDLAALFDAVRLDLAPLLLLAAATITVDVATGPTIRGAPKTLRSVLYNLLSNALKYRHPDRPAQVHLRSYCTPTHAVLDVQDNGLGLQPEQQARLFRLFERQHAHIEGSGVGLYMLKRLVENAGGTIAVQSEAGVGSTFTVFFPR